MRAAQYKFDLEYQHKLVGACFRIDGFLRSTYDCIRPEWFSNESLSRISTLAKLFYDRHKVSPTPAAIRTSIDDLLAGNALSDAQATQIRTTYTTCCSIELSEAHDIRERVAEFAQHQAMLTALIESADLLDAADYDGVLAKIERARKVGLRDELGLSFFHDVRPAIVQRERVATGFPSLDAKLKGGPGRGDGCVMVAPSGVGKSWWLMAIALAALEAGWDVVYYTLELAQMTADERFHMMTGTWRMLEEDRQAARTSLFRKLGTNLLIQFYPGGTVSVADLRRHFDTASSEGKIRKNKTLVVVDYGELLKPSKQFNEGYMTARQKYFELATWAQEDNTVVWTAQQTGKQGEVATQVTKDMIGDSWKIVCDYRVVLTLTSSREDRQKKKATVLIDKVTDSDGEDGGTFELTWHDGCRRFFENRGNITAKPAGQATPPKTQARKLPRV